MNAAQRTPHFKLRYGFVLLVFAVGMLGLIGRAVYLQVHKRDFLQGQGDARQQRVMAMPAYRGMITDRHGEPLAISTPMDSVWANPQELAPARDRLLEIAELLDVSDVTLTRRLTRRADKEFIYLRRHVPPDIAARVMALQIPGVNLQREYRRYYPLGEAAGHLLGFTNVDDRGQEGLELAFDDWLNGEPGSRRVIRDRLGHIVEDLELLQPPGPGKELRLSLDRRIQYLAYRELKKAVKQHGAKSGSIVVLDPYTGEVMAMVNQPRFNPNNRTQIRSEYYRNRTITDVFEPGSTMKPLLVAAALETGDFTPRTMIDTAPGSYNIRGHRIEDMHNYGRIDLSTVVSKSSNVGASKLALEMEPKHIWSVYRDFGLGQPTPSGFPGEAAGLLRDYDRWAHIDHATVAFGHSLSVTPLQLAVAYSALAADGLRPTPTFLLSSERGARTRVVSARTARQVRDMLEHAVGAKGTGKRAQIENYRVAGKTGTIHKFVAGGYSEDRYISVFAGMAPASRPRLVTVVMIDEPSGDYFGGQVAAPAFSAVMTGAMRILNVSPDREADPRLQANTPKLKAGAG